MQLAPFHAALFHILLGVPRQFLLTAGTEMGGGLGTQALSINAGGVNVQDLAPYPRHSRDGSSPGLHACCGGLGMSTLQRGVPGGCWIPPSLAN